MSVCLFSLVFFTVFFYKWILDVTLREYNYIMTLWSSK